MTKHEIVYGGFGSGKSSYAFSTLNPNETFKLGNLTPTLELLTLKFGSKKKHEEENRSENFNFKTTTLNSIIQDISKITEPCLLLDEWTTFFCYSFWWSEDKILNKSNEILDAVEINNNLQRGIYITSSEVPYMPLNLYKKRALWNKVLFKRANKITKIDFGIPIPISITNKNL